MELLICCGAFSASLLLQVSELGGTMQLQLVSLGRYDIAKSGADCGGTPLELF